VDIEKVIKQTKFQNSYHKALINLIYTSNYFRDSHHSVFKPYDIQTQHFNILRILNGKHPDPATPGYIKEVMLDKGRDLTRLIDKLEGMGWVSRTICPENKRKIHVNLTHEGLEKVKEISSNLDLLDNGMKHLTEEEYDHLSRLLDKMRG
jgi:DNA-binding MarR family transcriptional regulator